MCIKITENLSRVLACLFWISFLLEPWLRVIILIEKSILKGYFVRRCPKDTIFMSHKISQLNAQPKVVYIMIPLGHLSLV